MIGPLIDKIRNLGIHITLTPDGNLRVYSNSGEIRDDILAEIRSQKNDLIQFLKNNTGNNQWNDIPQVITQPDYVLSSSQRRLWIISQLEEVSQAYNIPGVFIFDGLLDVDILSRCVYLLIERHEVLRTVFRENAQGEVRQVVLPAAFAKVKVVVEDLRGTVGNILETKLSAEAATAYDLRSGPLLRVTLFRIADARWVLYYGMHHIISDGWSMDVLIGELSALYNSLAAGGNNNLQPLRIQYKDYAEWEQQPAAGALQSEARDYWLRQFSGELPVLELPSDKPRPAVKTYHGGVVKRKIDGLPAGEFRELCHERNITLFMGLLALTNTLLYRYTRQEDIIIGTPVAGREHPDLENQIGFYVNTLALRTRLDGSMSFCTLLDQVRETTLHAFKYQSYSFDKLVEELAVKRDKSRNVLFDVMVVLQGINRKEWKGQSALKDLSVLPFEEFDSGATKFDLTFSFAERAEGISLELEYNADIYSAAGIARMAEHLVQLLQAVTATPLRPIDDIGYLTVAEREMLIALGQGPSQHMQSYTSVLQLFQEQVIKCPEAAALVTGSEEVSYRLLDELSGQLANYLRHRYSIQRDDRIGIRQQRSKWMIISILGILKAGAAYVPVDPDYPEDRISYIIDNSGCKMTIDEAAITDFQHELHSYGSDCGERVLTGAELAYVIYTSGSTGRPKGCMISHHNLLNYIGWANTAYFNEIDKPVFPLFTSLSFDLTVTSIFCPLTSGGALYIYEPSVELADVLQHAVSKESMVNCIKATPSHVSVLRELNLSEGSLVVCILGGEEVTQWHIRTLKHIDAAMQVYNEYGPTETTVGCIVTMLDPEKPVIIGKPIANTLVYLLDAAGQLCPEGIPGEICIGGHGVGLGYLHQEALTAEKYQDDPFVPGSRVYHTGDYGRWLPDGNLAFMGRRDDQIKLHGYRIELGEIERTLQGFPGVVQSAVLVRPDGQHNGDLMAFVQVVEDVTVEKLRTYLLGYLPGYMVPSRYVCVDHFPLTVNGKLDKQALLAMSLPELQTGEAYVGARSHAELSLLAVCEEVLRRRGIGMRDDFFMLGGDSIKSIQVVSRLKQRGYSLTIRDVMYYSRLEDMAGRLRSTVRVVDQGQVSGMVALSPIQHYFFNLPGGGLHHYNQSVLLVNRERVSPEGIMLVLQKLTEHHDALRMVYRQQAGIWQQENLPPVHGSLLDIMEVTDEETYRQGCDAFQAVFDLEKGPLFRGCLFRMKQEDRLLLAAHHLVIDGVSWRIILEDLALLFEQYNAGQQLALPQKSDSFRYWMECQRAYALSNELAAEAMYWSAVEAAVVPPLPVDRESAVNTMEDIRNGSFLLEEATTKLLQTACYSAYSTDINDVLITALCMALRSVFNRPAVILGMEGHGREDIGAGVDVTRTVGWFTTSYPVLMELAPETDMVRDLIQVKETLHRIPNKGMGYGVLRYLAGAAYTLCPEITYNYLGDFGTGTGLGEKDDSTWRLSGGYRGKEHAGSLERRSLLDITGMIVGGRLSLSVSYSCHQYEENTIRQLTAAFREHLEQLISRLSSEKERHLTPADLTYRQLTMEQLVELGHSCSIEDVYPLSPLQQGLYYHWRTDPRAAVYDIRFVFRVKANLDKTLLEKSYALLVSRYAVLRTFFTDKLGDQVLQVVQQQVAPAFTCIDAAGVIQDEERLFDLHQGTQMRLTVLASADNNFEFIWSYHHILMDGWCVGILIRTFFEIYRELAVSGVSQPVKTMPYSAYIGWLEKVNKEKSLEYWQHYLSGYEAASTLPAAIADAAVPYDATVSALHIDLDMEASITAICTAWGITKSVFLQVAWGLLLARYNFGKDVVFGLVVSGRPPELEGVEEMIGLFSNTVPVRITLTENHTVETLLKMAQEKAVESTDHHYVQLAEIQQKSVLGANLFDHVFVYENFPVQEITRGPLDVTGWQLELEEVSSEGYRRSHYNLMLTVLTGRTSTIEFNYNRNWYSDADIARYQEGLQQVLTAMCSGIQPLPALLNAIVLPPVPGMEAFTAPLEERREAAPVHVRFEAVAEAYAARIAIDAGEDCITYEKLNAFSNRLANLIITTGPVQGRIVNVVMPSSISLVAVMLAVFKCNGIYLPVDPGFASKRLRQIFTDTWHGTVIVSDSMLDALLGIARELDLNIGRLIVVDGNDDITLHSYDTGTLHEIPFYELPDWQNNPPRLSGDEDASYIFYTSGSTGEGNAILGSHASLRQFVDWEIATFEIGCDDRVSQLTKITFDASLRDVFAALLSGGTLCIPSAEDRSSAQRLLQWLTEARITLVHCVPSLFRMMLKEMEETTESADGLSALRYILMAGEHLFARDINSWRKRVGSHVRLVNLYGATETTLVKSFYRIETAGEDGARTIPAGKPISGAAIAVIKDQRLCYPGETGEIYIRTPYASLGYYNNPALMKERFIQNPLVPTFTDIVYKTGDLGRWLPDGNLEVLGRIDHQVKINGIRVEIPEVERAILQCAGIREVVVLPHQDGDNSVSLIAYYTGSNKDIREWRKSLSELLNHELIPSYFVHLHEFPLNSNGKTDRKALPLPRHTVTPNGSQLPVNETELKLEEIWSRILGLGRIGRNVSFFSIGGHSLKLLQLLSRIQKEFAIEVTIADLFLHDTIQQQASMIAGAGGKDYTNIPRAPQKDRYPLSYAQQRLWMLCQFEGASVAYNMSWNYTFRGEIDRDALAAAFRTLINRYEILRTAFRTDETGALHQYILDMETVRFEIEQVDLRDSDEKDAAGKWMEAFESKPFDLSCAPLIRVSLCRTADDTWLLTYVMHHIISDGWSMGVLLKEILAVYQAYAEGRDYELPPLPIQYKDYAVWQRSRLEEGRFDMHRDYWLQQLSGTLPVFGITTDRVRPPVKTYHGRSVVKMIDEKQTALLYAWAEKEGVTPFMVLVTAVSAVLHRYSGHDDIIIGTPAAGRTHLDLENQLGFFVNTLPLRIRIKVKNSCLDLLEQVKQTTLDAFEHQDYPFNMLVEQLNLDTDMSRNALFEVMVVLQNNERASLSGSQALHGIETAVTDNAYHRSSKFDLVFNFLETDGCIGLNLEYNTDIYGEALITRLAGHLDSMLQAVLQNPLCAVGEIGYLHADERRLLISGYNGTGNQDTRSLTVTDLFRKQAKATPDNVALIHDGKTMTYQELDRETDRIGTWLSAYAHIGDGDLVTIRMARSEWLIISMIAVLKTGAAYIPVDPGYPEERISYMTTDSRSKFVITDELTGIWQECPAADGVLPVLSPLAPIYVIYTSGSTGQPKGAVVRHHSFANLCCWYARDLGLAPSDCMMLIAPVSFDLAQKNIFTPLMVGAKLFIPKQVAGGYRQLAEHIAEQGVTVINAAPSAFYPLMDVTASDNFRQLASLRKVVLGGEPILQKEFAGWLASGFFNADLINSYGPTECTDVVSSYTAKREELGSRKALPIGMAIDNVRLYVLDEMLQLLPVGIAGELFISGDCVGNGYLHNPELTAEKFIPDPFCHGQVMYRTGDICKRLPNGNIEYIGRHDTQVKIRGHRIETGEVERVLNDCPGVDAVVVTARAVNTRELDLVAYIVTQTDPDLPAMMAYLNNKLPASMLPAFFVRLNKLPLTPSGKVDRKNLPDPTVNSLSTSAYVPPGTPTEEKLVAVWEELFSRQRIGIRDDFFQLGGHSLKLIQLLSRINLIFGVQIDIQTVFGAPTIEGVAGHIDFIIGQGSQKDLQSRLIQIQI